MQICIVNTLDCRSGAAIAALRLFEELRRNSGERFRMVVRSRLGNDVQGVSGLNCRRNSVISLMDKIPWMLQRRAKSRIFSSQWIGHPRALGLIGDADIVHLHWVAGGFLSPWQIARLKGALVWTLHDLNPLTGGCHYPGKCDRFTIGCGSCPLLHGGQWDISSRNLTRRRRLLDARPIHFISPSHWLASKAKQSQAIGNCEVEVIHNGINTATFTPNDTARQLLGYPDDKVIITYVADDPGDPRKGLDLLIHGLSSVSPAQRNRVLLVIIGRRPESLANLPIETRFVGPIWEETALAKHLQASDWTICPSREDNLPNILLESLGCGTPVAGFATGGIAEIIQSGKNGILAPPFDAEMLINAMLSVPIPQLRADWRDHARKDACTRFDIRKQAVRLLETYTELLTRCTTRSNLPS